MLIYLKITVASIKFPKQIGRNSEGFRKNFLYIKKCIQKSEELAIFPYFRWKFGRILQILRIRRKTPNFGGAKRSESDNRSKSDNKTTLDNMRNANHIYYDQSPAPKIPAKSPIQLTY